MVDREVERRSLLRQTLIDSYLIRYGGAREVVSIASRTMGVTSSGTKLHRLRDTVTFIFTREIVVYVKEQLCKRLDQFFRHTLPLSRLRCSREVSH